MRCSSTEARLAFGAPRRPRGRSVLAVALGGLVGALAGLGLPGPGTTAAQLTGSAGVTSAVTVGPCEPTGWSQAVAALAPVLEWHFEPAALRVGDVPAPALPACDPTTAAWDLAGTFEGGLTTTAPVPLTSPADLTITLLVDATTGPAGEGEMLRVDGAAVVLRLVVVPGGAIELHYTDALGGPVVLTAPAISPRATAHLVAVTSGPAGSTLYVDGAPVAAGPPGAGAVDPVSLTLGAAPGSGLSGADLVVDEVLVLDQVLDPAAVADLAQADTW